LHPKTLAQLKKGLLKITISHMGGKPKIHGFQPYFGAARGDIRISVGNDNQQVVFEDNCSGNYALTLWRTAKVHIGESTTSNGVSIFCADSEFVAGKDCMFSSDILVQSSDQHGLVDLETGKLFNTGFRSVVLEDHVWLGRKCILLPDVTVRRGAVVGTGAVVTSDVGPASIVAGVPARTVKDNVTWTRPAHELDAYSRRMVQEFDSLKND
jgi:acetyltransferase-like isoleucine patch superfamily enzyme